MAGAALARFPRAHSNLRADNEPEKKQRIPGLGC